MTNLLHMAPIIVAGAVAIAIMIERAIALMWVYPIQAQNGFFKSLRDFIMADRLNDAVSLCDRMNKKPVARVVREALLRAHQPEIVIEDGLEIAVTDAMMQIQKRTQFLATIANVATLLGLLGTILGLIHSFEAVGTASAQQRSAMLAAGISTAMNATMLGLCVAIPCMIAFSYLMNRTNRLSAEVQQSAVRVLDLLRQRYYAAEMEKTNPKNAA